MFAGPGQSPAVERRLAIAEHAIVSMQSPGTPSTAQSEAPPSVIVPLPLLVLVALWVLVPLCVLVLVAPPSPPEPPPPPAPLPEVFPCPLLPPPEQAATSAIEVESKTK